MEKFLRSAMKMLILPALLAGLAVLAFPPYFNTWLLFFTFPLLFWLLYNAKTSFQAYSIGFSYGFSFSVVILQWVILAFINNGMNSSSWMKGLIIIIFPLCMALLLGLIFLVIWRIPVKGLAKIIIFALGWGIFIWFTGRIFPHIPLSVYGYAWVFNDVVMQLSAYIGIYGLSYVTVLICTSPIALLMPIDRKLKLIYLSLMTLLALGLYAGGYYRLKHAHTAYYDTSVRILHTHTPSIAKSAQEKTADFARLISSSTQASANKLDMIIWPEGAVDNIYLLNHKLIGKTITAISKIVPKGGAVLVNIDTGLAKQSWKPQESINENDISLLQNSLLAIGPNADVLGIYHKLILMPFSEYNPMGWLFKSPKLLDVLKSHDLTTVVDYTPGAERPALKVGKHPSFGTLICYEAMFSGEVIQKGQRPDWLLVISSDYWLRDTIGVDQHFLTSKVRAVEEGLPLLRSANYGYSAVIDPYGRTLQQMNPGTVGVIDTKLPKPILPTVYALYGNWILLGLWVVSIAVVWLLRVKD